MWRIWWRYFNIDLRDKSKRKRRVQKDSSQSVGFSQGHSASQYTLKAMLGKISQSEINATQLYFNDISKALRIIKIEWKPLRAVREESYYLMNAVSCHVCRLKLFWRWTEMIYMYASVWAHMYRDTCMEIGGHPYHRPQLPPWFGQNLFVAGCCADPMSFPLLSQHRAQKLQVRITAYSKRLPAEPSPQLWYIW